MSALRRSVAPAILTGLSLLVLVVVPALGRASGRARAATAHRIVSLAQAELAKGVHEVPDGSNNSPSIARYRTATVGAMRGAPWCAYFVSYVAKNAGAPIGYRGEGMGYVPYIRDWARKTGRWSRKPKPGYLITFPQHVGIVEHVYSNHTLTSIEGNTSNAVRRRYHSWGEAVGYVRLADGGGIESPSAPHPQTTPVHEKLVARIRAYPDDRPAVGENVDFSAQDSSGNITRYDWDLTGDGKWDAHGPAAAHTWHAPGTYTVKLRVTDKSGKHSTATETIYVHGDQPPHPALSLDQTWIHEGGTIRMDAAASHDDDGHIVKYQWDYAGDGFYQPGGAKTSHTYKVPGQYVVRVRVTDDAGNVSETSQPITVAAYEPPVASASCDQPVVSTGATVHCNADDSGSPYHVTKHEWDTTSDGSYDLRGGDVSFSYRTAGSYSVHLRVTDENGKTAETNVGIRVVAPNRPPVAQITLPAAANIGQGAAFDGTHSSDPDGGVVRYDWDLNGDGTYESTGTNPAWTYSAPGPYTVKLKVTDGAGATATSTATLTVHDPTDLAPVARLTLPTTAIAGVPLTLSAAGSSDPDGTIRSYQWDYNGDGVIDRTTSRATSVTTTYATPGWYRVTLTIVDDDWSQTTTSAWLRVN